MVDIEKQVKRANREFYDIVGASYELFDGRRSPHLIRYVSDQLRLIAQHTDADSILDLGCGLAFVSRIAERYFARRYAADISFNIIKAIEDDTLWKMSADSDYLPLKSDRLSCIVTFALLHHCYSYRRMLSEIYRVLKPGGIYYSDHDMDADFHGRFRLPLNVYRRIHNARGRWLAHFHELSEKLYRCSEFCEDGIPSKDIVSALKEIGFSKVSVEYHWFGLSRVTDVLFRRHSYGLGYAPLVKIIAVK